MAVFIPAREVVLPSLLKLTEETTQSKKKKKYLWKYFRMSSRGEKKRKKIPNAAYCVVFRGLL